MIEEFWKLKIVDPINGCTATLYTTYMYNYFDLAPQGHWTLQDKLKSHIERWNFETFFIPSALVGHSLLLYWI